MGGILEGIYADEFWVVATNNVPDGLFLDLPWPFKIPPECGKEAVASCGMQTGVTACDADGWSGYKVGDWTHLEDCVHSKGAFDEA